MGDIKYKLGESIESKVQEHYEGLPGITVMGRTEKIQSVEEVQAETKDRDVDFIKLLSSEKQIIPVKGQICLMVEDSSGNGAIRKYLDFLANSVEVVRDTEIENFKILDLGVIIL